MGKEETCKPTGNINCLNTFYVVLKLPDLECAMVYGNIRKTNDYLASQRLRAPRIFIKKIGRMRGKGCVFLNLCFGVANN